MAGRECYHCKQWVEEGESHDCWTTTEAALTADLPDDLRDAWERLRATAVTFGDQRIYASHNSIMFSRKACYCFVRPRRSYLEVCIFLGRAVTSPQIARALPSSKTKFAHLIRVRHRDEVEAPLTDWMQEAYRLQDVLVARDGSRRPAAGSSARSRRKAPSARGRTGPTPKGAAAGRKTRRRARASKRR
jgi:hypothetical protein